MFNFIMEKEVFYRAGGNGSEKKDRIYILADKVKKMRRRMKISGTGKRKADKQEGSTQVRQDRTKGTRERKRAINGTSDNRREQYAGDSERNRGRERASERAAGCRQAVRTKDSRMNHRRMPSPISANFRPLSPHLPIPPLPRHSSFLYTETNTDRGDASYDLDPPPHRPFSISQQIPTHFYVNKQKEREMEKNERGYKGGDREQREKTNALSWCWSGST